MQRRMILKIQIFVVLLMIVGARQANGQQEVTLFAEPFAGGVQYLVHPAAGLRLGAAVTGGQLDGVTVAEADGLRDPDNWATAYLLIGHRNAAGVQILANVGAAVVGGDDVAAVYPSAQLNLELAIRHFRVGTALRTIRIAGTNNTGDYWTTWVPLRFGITLGN